MVINLHYLQIRFDQSSVARHAVSSRPVLVLLLLGGLVLRRLIGTALATAGAVFPSPRSGSANPPPEGAIATPVGKENPGLPVLPPQVGNVLDHAFNARRDLLHLERLDVF